MINSKDLATLLSLLGESDKPFETIATTFYRTFSKSDHFKIGCAIYTIIKDGFIRIPSQRLIAFYILFSLYKPDSSILLSGSLSSSSIVLQPPTTQPQSQQQDTTITNTTNENENITNIHDYPISLNPFLPIFIDELEKQFDSSNTTTTTTSNNNNIEKQILPLFLTNLPKDFSKKTPKEIINTHSTTTAQSNTNNNNNNTTNNISSSPTTFTKSSLKEYKNFYLERLPSHCYPSFRSIGVSQNILLTKNQPQPQQQQQHTSPNNTSSTTIKNHEIYSEELSFFSFEPNFKRVDPPIFNPVSTIWINSSINHGLLLSNPPPIITTTTPPPTTTTTTTTTSTIPPTATTITTTTTNNSKKIVRDLMTKAIKGRLKRNQAATIKNEMDLNPKLALYCGLTPKNLPFLVENNTQVAIDVLLKLINQPIFRDHFESLISMEMNFRSMEVVNTLARSSDLPHHFIPMYITNCIESCKQISSSSNDDEKLQQQRLVRLVCVFIQSLIRNNIINIKNMFAEVQSFCLEFSKIREAISLFKAINENNNNNNEEDDNNTNNNNNTTTTTNNNNKND